MEKAIDIKRRAQRFIQAGDVDAALVEYEKLARSEEADPYHSVVIADLLFKKGDQTGASQRYLNAVEGYEKAGLYKNGIAVCKKMARLGLAPGLVFQRLAQLHAADGLTTEAALFHMQHAEYAVRVGNSTEAAQSFRLAFESSKDNVAALERLAELHRSNGENEKSLAVFHEAVAAYERLGNLAEANRCRRHMRQLDPSVPPEPAEEPARGARNEAPGRGTRNEAPGRGANPVADATPAPVDDLVRPPEGEPSGVERLDGLMDTRRKVPVAEVERIEIEGSQSRFESEAPPPLAAPALSAAPPLMPPPIAPTPAPPALAPPTLTPPTFGPPMPAPPTLAPSGPAPPTLTPPALAPPAREKPSDAAASRPGAAAPQFRLAPMTPPDAPPAAPPAALADVSYPPRPGLRFPEPETENESEPIAGADAEDFFWELVPDAAVVPDVLAVVQQAQECFRHGDREETAALLVHAAECYETLDQPDSAARVFRVLRRNLTIKGPALLMWLENCRRRNDRGEAANVACDLGDEALEGGDPTTAREWFESATTYEPGHTLARQRLAHLGQPSLSSSVVTAAPLPGVPEPDLMPSPRPAPPTKAATPVARTASAPAAPTAPATASDSSGHVRITYGQGEPPPMDIRELVDRFRSEVQSQTDGDADSQYALGVSYLEMGLVDQAIEALRSASENAELKGRACELIARCMMDQGRFEEAALEFQAALDQPGLSAEASNGLRFEVGLAFEAGGRLDEALAQFEHVYGEQPSFPSVASKIRALRRTLESE